jgi:anti-sigma regulatory factor (Ser/Thr protein kinase)
MSTYTQGLLGVPGAARAAREFTAEVLAAAGCPARDDALLCVSEMVTNAVQHSKSAGPAGLIRLHVAAEPGERVQIAVEDDGPAPMGPSAPDGEHGRGCYSSPPSRKPTQTTARDCTGAAWPGIPRKRESR